MKDKIIHKLTRLSSYISFHGAICLTLIQLLVFVPFFFPKAKPPLYFKYTSLKQYDLFFPVVSILLGHSFICFSAMAFLILITNYRLLIVGGIILYFQFFAMLVSVYYYLYFGGYPKLQVIYDIIQSPKTVIGYGLSIADKNEILVIVFFSLLSIILIKCALNPLRRHENCLHSFLFSLLIGSSLTGAGLYMTQMPNMRNIFGVAQYHTHPSYMWWGSLTTKSRGNSVELVKKYIPTAGKSKVYSPFKAPDHIVLIIAESQRSDHYSFYGYERNTTPRLFKKKSEWIVFKNFYTSEPLTSAALASAIGSRYLAISNDQHQVRTNSLIFWEHLSKKSYRPSIFSSGRLKWGNMYVLIGADQIEDVFSYDRASKNEKHTFELPDRIDYHLNDWIVLKHYRNFIKSITVNKRRSISLFYLVNTHFPYFSFKEDRKFYPSLNRMSASASSSSNIRSFSNCLIEQQKCINSYDNSILSFDRFLEELLVMLSKFNILQSSLIIVTSDHGECFGEHHTFFHGSTLYNEITHIPLLIRVGRNLPELKARLSANRNNVYSMVDIAPTLLESAGIRQPDTFHGTSMLSTYPKPYEILVVTTLGKKVAIVTTTHKYIYDLETRKAFDFNMISDHQELNNLWVHNESNLTSFLKTLETRQIISRTAQ